MSDIFSIMRCGKMKSLENPTIFSFHIDGPTRAKVEEIAASERRSAGFVIRDLIAAGMRLKGIA